MNNKRGYSLVNGFKLLGKHHDNGLVCAKVFNFGKLIEVCSSKLKSASALDLKEIRSKLIGKGERC
jgi:hypothetical protein